MFSAIGILVFSYFSANTADIMPSEKTQKLSHILESKEFYPRGSTKGYLEKLKENAFRKGKQLWQQLKGYFDSASDSDTSGIEFPGLLSSLLSGIAWLVLISVLLLFLYWAVTPLLRMRKKFRSSRDSEEPMMVTEDLRHSKEPLGMIFNKDGALAALSELRLRLRKDIFEKANITALSGLSDRSLLKSCENLDSTIVLREAEIFRNTASVFEEVVYAKNEIDDERVSQLVADYQQSVGAAQ